MSTTIEEIKVSQSLIDDISNLEGERNVIAFNNDYTPIQWVINVLMNVVPMNFEEAQHKTIEIHTTGKSVVFTGSYEHCAKIASALNQIKVDTVIEP